MEKILRKEWIGRYKDDSDSILQEISNFLIENKLKLLSIQENIYFNPKKERLTRIIIYYKENQKEFQTKPIKKINLNGEKRDIEDILEKINSFLEKNPNLEILNYNDNHYIDLKTLMIRISLFVQKK